MSTALTTTTNLNDMELGNVLARSGYFKDARDASQAIVKVLFGREIGIGPVSAMMGVHIIEGRPAPSANLIAARIKSSGRYDYRVREHTNDACRLEFFERDSKGGKESLGVVEWTMDDAKRAGLAGKAGSPWQKYPRAMLFARAISEGARVHAPELFGGAPVYTPEELGAEVDAEGNAVVISSEPLESGPELMTDEQRTLIGRLICSHVVTDEERAKMDTAVRGGMTKERASRAIDKLLGEIKARKEIERQERAAAGEDAGSEAEMEAAGQEALL
jgi:hypothetical protein